LINEELQGDLGLGGQLFLTNEELQGDLGPGGQRFLTNEELQGAKETYLNTLV
ncbi:hypothetical protein AVEN_153294-1, partial [Araneus ventricosus]